MSIETSSSLIINLKRLLVSNGFKQISEVNNNSQMMYKKGKFIAMIDYEMVEENYCVYIMKNYKYIYRKTIEEEKDAEPLFRLARSVQ